MKKALFSLCLFAAFGAFADNTSVMSASELCSAMQDMRSYDWGQPAGKLEGYLYPLYRTSTADKAAAAEIEKKAVEELKSGEGTTRYKELLGETLAICGINSSAAELADIVAKNYAKEENRRWVERVMIALGRASDKATKDALLKLAKQKGYIAVDAISALGSRGEADKEIAQMLATSGKDKSKFYACVSALARISSPASVKALLNAAAKSQDPAMKLAAGEALFSAASSGKKAAAVLKDSALKFYNDSKSPLPLQLASYSVLVRLADAPAPKSKDFLIAAIDVFGKNKNLKAPSFLDFSRLEEPEQALLVQAYARRGDGYEQIIKLSPKFAPLAEAIAFAASRMGSEKDFQKLASFAPLFGDREKAVLAQYISEIRAKGKLLKLSDLAKSAKSEDEKKVLLMATENLDSSSVADTLLDAVKNGSPDEKAAALKTLNTAQTKNAYVFVKVAELYPTFGAKEAAAAQRLMVNLSRVSCSDEMFKAALAQYNKASDQKTKGFFIRFAAPCGSAAAGEFLAKAYGDGLKSEALREFARFKNGNALEALKKVEKSDPANKEAIRNVGISIVHQNRLLDSPYVKYIMSTAINEREKNLSNMLEMPSMANADQANNLPGGLKARATHSAGELRRAFDGDMNSRWSSGISREPGIAIMFEFPNSEEIKGFEFMLGGSTNDRVLEPKVFVGDSMDNMRAAEIKYEKAPKSDVLTFKAPQKAKFVCVVNTKSSGGNWSIHEIKIEK